MNDRRDAQRLKRSACKFRSIDGRGRRKFLSVHVGEIDASALEHLSIRDDSGPAPASTGPLPHILDQFRGRVLGQ